MKSMLNDPYQEMYRLYKLGKPNMREMKRVKQRENERERKRERGGGRERQRTRDRQI